MLTIKKLKEMPENFIFARGYGQDGTHKIKWLAQRGCMHDWCIYYHLRDKNWQFIEGRGDKFFSEDKIKDMVVCDDEAFKLYRY